MAEVWTQLTGFPLPKTWRGATPAATRPSSWPLQRRVDLTLFFNKLMGTIGKDPVTAWNLMKANPGKTLAILKWGGQQEGRLSYLISKLAPAQLKELGLSAAAPSGIARKNQIPRYTSSSTGYRSSGKSLSQKIADAKVYKAELLKLYPDMDKTDAQVLADYEKLLRQKQAINAKVYPDLNKTLDQKLAAFENEQDGKIAILKQKYPEMYETAEARSARIKQQAQADQRDRQAVWDAAKEPAPVQAGYIRLMRSNWSKVVADELDDEGIWDDVLKWHPEAWTQVVETRLDGFAKHWLSQVRSYDRWDVRKATSGMFTEEQLAQMAARDTSFAAALQDAGVKVKRPMTMARMIQAKRQLEDMATPDSRYIMIGGGLLPRMRVPLPESKGLQLNVTRQAATPSAASLKTNYSQGYTAPASKLNMGEPAGESPTMKQLLESGPKLSVSLPSTKAPVTPKQRLLAGSRFIASSLIQTGVIPQSSPFAQAFSGYETALGVTAALKGMGMAASVAGPVGIAVGIAATLSGIFGSKKAKEQEREQRRAARRMSAAQNLRGQVGYVPSTVHDRSIRKPVRGKVRPFAPLYPSRLGLVAATRTPEAHL